MTGRNEIAMNNASSQSIQTHVANIRRNYTYPAWFENTLRYAHEGSITERDLFNAVDNLSKQDLLKLSADPIARPPITQKIYTKSEIEKIMIDYYGDDIEMLHGHASDLGTQMNINWDKSQAQRDRIDAEIIKGANERQLFHDMHLDQETRISRNAENIGKKADIGHKHSSTGGCAWYDLQCHVSEGFEGLGKLALIGGVAIVGIWLLKMRLGK